MTAMRKVATASALALVLSATVPTHLLAAEREAPATVRATTIERLSSLWHDLVALFAPDTTTPTKPVDSPTSDGRCTIDPNGGNCTP